MLYWLYLQGVSKVCLCNLCRFPMTSCWYVHPFPDPFCRFCCQTSSWNFVDRELKFGYRHFLMLNVWRWWGRMEKLVFFAVSNYEFPCRSVAAKGSTHKVKQADRVHSQLSFRLTSVRFSLWSSASGSFSPVWLNPMWNINWLLFLKVQEDPRISVTSYFQV